MKLGHPLSMAKTPLYFAATSVLTIKGASASCVNSSGYYTQCPDVTNIIIGSIASVVTTIVLIMCCVCCCRQRTTKEPAKDVLPTHTANPTPLQVRKQPNPYKSVGEAPPEYSPEPPTRPLPTHNRQEETTHTTVQPLPPPEREDGVIHMPMPQPHAEPSDTALESHSSNTNPFRV